MWSCNIGVYVNKPYTIHISTPIPSRSPVMYMRYLRRRTGPPILEYIFNHESFAFALTGLHMPLLHKCLGPWHLHPTPYTLHPTPHTLNPQTSSSAGLHMPLLRGWLGPWHLHPTPFTLHPTPYTLHPTPYTLHPTPYTLHPTP